MFVFELSRPKCEASSESSNVLQVLGGHLSALGPLIAVPWQTRAGGILIMISRRRKSLFWHRRTKISQSDSSMIPPPLPKFMRLLTGDHKLHKMQYPTTYSSAKKKPSLLPKPDPTPSIADEAPNSRQEEDNKTYILARKPHHPTTSKLATSLHAAVQ